MIAFLDTVIRGHLSRASLRSILIVQKSMFDASRLSLVIGRQHLLYRNVARILLVPRGGARIWQIPKFSCRHTIIQ